MKALIEAASNGGCYPATIAPRLAFRLSGLGAPDPNAPTETPTEKEARLFCAPVASPTGSGPQEKGSFCRPSFRFAINDNIDGGDSYRARIVEDGANDVAATDANFQWLSTHRSDVGDTTLQVAESYYNFMNFVEIAQGECCLWRQVLLSSHCFLSRGGEQLVDGALPESALSLVCGNVVDYGWFPAESYRVSHDRHSPRFAGGVTQTTKGWMYNIRTFLVQAYCLRKHTVVKEFQWGYLFRNFKPRQAPRGKDGRLAEYSVTEAFGELRVWLGAPGADRFDPGAGRPLNRVLTRTQYMNS